MGIQKRRRSKARTASRRAQWKLRAPHLVECPQCHNRRVPHRVCPTCGYYDGRQVIEVEEPETRKGA